MAYFDNAATSYPKPNEVYSFMDSFYRNYGGSAGRGNYALANTAKGIIDETRQILKDLMHCPAKQVVFTPTATIALNIVIQGMIKNGARNVYISPFEHNAVTRVLHYYEKAEQINVIELPVTKMLEYDYVRMRYQFDSARPDLVIVSHASNVSGFVSPVEEIFALAKEYGATTIVDMAQTAGLVDINVGLETIDFAVFAGHKTLLGPTGISGFLMNPAVDLPPVLFGGTGYESANQDMPNSLPEKYEMGTLNIAGIAGLNASLKWIRENTIKWLFEEEEKKRKQGNVIAFSGSMNESANAFTTNYEAIDVFCSWTQDAERVYTKETAFNAMWDDYEPSIKVVNFPDINDEILRRYRVNNKIDNSIVGFLQFNP